MTEIAKAIIRAPARPGDNRTMAPWGKSGELESHEMANRFGMTLTQLAETAGLSPQSLYKTERANSPKTQTRLREILEIITRVTDWSGGVPRAMAWYRAQPIPAFGGRTAEALVKEGKAGVVRDYLDQIALGGFA